MLIAKQQLLLSPMGSLRCLDAVPPGRAKFSGCWSQPPISLSRFSFVDTAATISCFSPLKLKVSPQNVGRIPGRTIRQTRVLALRRQGEDNSLSPEQEEGAEDVSPATLIWRAIKLPIYSVALVPLTVAGAAAYYQTGIFSAERYFGLLASSACILTWLHLSNDVYDFDTGADKNKKESVVNMVGSRTGTLAASYLLLASGFMGLTWMAVEAGNFRSILLLACAIMCGYIYQCPPFRLGYLGLGEPLCFAAFGPFATTAFYLIQMGSRQVSRFPSVTVLAASVIIGYTTSLILFCSHFHQVEGDRAVGKFSPLVRIGHEMGAQVVKAAVMTFYGLIIVFGVGRALPLPCTVMCALTFPMGNVIINYVKQHHNDNAKIFMSKYYCVRLHVLLGLALALGLVAAKKLG